MDLVDALSSNTSATSLVELSLNPAFRREYPSIFDGIESFFQPKPTPDAPASAETTESSLSVTAQRLKQEQAMTRLIGSTIPPLNHRSFYLTATDVTSNPRPFSPTLEDRVFTHSPNPVSGNRPITIGHAYSALVYLPEKEKLTDPNWVVPLSIRRVASDSLETVVGADQIKGVMADTALPFHQRLTVNVADTKYSSREHVSRISDEDHLVTIVRSAGNRVFYQSRPARSEDNKRPAHRPAWFGPRFDMKDPDTWHSPSETAQLTTVTKKGKKLTFRIQCWDDMLMSGKNGIDMHESPFRLVRVICVDEADNPVFKRPMWLLVFGNKRNELTLTDIVKAYQQRYDIEHFFRFGKQKLLLTAAQTPNVGTEENWWQIVMLAYTQLWAARHLAQQTPRPWERYQPPKSTTITTPSATLRDFARLIQQFGTFAKPTKPRGKSTGRKKNDKQTPRKRYPVIKKSKSPPQINQQ